MLIPLSEEEASAWLAIFCDPICGASLLMPLLTGAKVPDRRGSMSSLDAFSPTGGGKVEDLFVTVPPESLKTRRKSVVSSTGTAGVGSSSGGVSGGHSAVTSSAMTQSNVALEEARQMMSAATADLDATTAIDLSDDEERTSLDLTDGDGGDNMGKNEGDDIATL